MLPTPSSCSPITAPRTVRAGVVHEDDLPEQRSRRGVQDAVHRAQQRGPRFVVEHDDDAGGGEGRAAFELLVDAPTGGEDKKEKGRKSRIYRSYAPGMKNGEGVWGGGRRARTKRRRPPLRRSARRGSGTGSPRGSASLISIGFTSSLPPPFAPVASGPVNDIPIPPRPGVPPL